MGAKKNIFHQFVIITISGWWCNNHLEKYSSMGRIIPYMLGLLFPIDGKIKHVPNHQPHMVVFKGSTIITGC
jgi:hypothetical protein